MGVARRLQTALGLQKREELARPFGVVAGQPCLEPRLDCAFAMMAKEQRKKIAERAEPMERHGIKQSALSGQNSQLEFEALGRARLPKHGLAHLDADFPVRHPAFIDALDVRRGP